MFSSWADLRSKRSRGSSEDVWKALDNIEPAHPMTLERFTELLPGVTAKLLTP